MPTLVQYHRKDLAIARELQNTHGELDALINLGRTHIAMGNPDMGKEALEVALGIAQDRQDTPAIAELHSILGACENERGNFRKALRLHTVHLEIAVKAKDVESEIDACANVGSTLLAMVQSIKPVPAVGTSDTSGNEQPKLSMSFRQVELLKRAKATFERHLFLVREAGDQAGESHGLAGLGETLRLLGEYTEAIGYYRECMHIQVRFFQ